MAAPTGPGCSPGVGEDDGVADRAGESAGGDGAARRGRRVLAGRLAGCCDACGGGSCSGAGRGLPATPLGLAGLAQLLAEPLLVTLQLVQVLQQLVDLGLQLDLELGELVASLRPQVAVGGQLDAQCAGVLQRRSVTQGQRPEQRGAVGDVSEVTGLDEHGQRRGVAPHERDPRSSGQLLLDLRELGLQCVVTPIEARQHLLGGRQLVGQSLEVAGLRRQPRLDGSDPCLRLLEGPLGVTDARHRGDHQGERGEQHGGDDECPRSHVRHLRHPRRLPGLVGRG